MCVGHRDLYADFIPLACADELCYMIVEVSYATASSIDGDYCKSTLGNSTQDQLVVEQSVQT